MLDRYILDLSFPDKFQQMVCILVDGILVLQNWGVECFGHLNRIETDLATYLPPSME